MKKKLLLTGIALAALFFGTQSVAAEGLGLYVNPSVYAILGSQNYIRGFAGAVDARLDLFGVITPGVEALVEYDSYLKGGTIPLYLTLGWENIWFGAGQSTFLGTSAPIGGVAVKSAPFPNTLLVGFGIPIVPIGDKSKIKIGGEVTWTRMIAASTGYGEIDQINDALLFFAGLKVYLGLTIQLGI